MPSIGYFGTYARFVTLDKRDAVAFLGNDNIIGSPFSIETEYSEGSRKAWIVNPFGAKMGLIDEKTASEVELCNAKGWETKALLALVAYSEQPEPGQYWGEVAIISYDPRYKEAFSAFIANFGKKLGSGIRGDLNIGQKSLQEIITTNGQWFPTARKPLPAKEKGTAFVKTERSNTERLVEQARKGNMGCLIGSWAFLLAIVALIVFGLFSCGIF